MTVRAVKGYYCVPLLTIASWLNPCVDLRLEIIRSLHQHPGVVPETVTSGFSVSSLHIISCVMHKQITIILKYLKFLFFRVAQ